MESILKKFERNAIDMSKIYGGEPAIFTGEMSYATDGGAVYRGNEYLQVDADGCGYIYLQTASGRFFVDFVC